MCEFSGKLIAWLDLEHPAEEAAEVERHLEACLSCRSDVDIYKRVSSEFDAYCDEAMVSNVPRRVPLWAPVVPAAGAVAAGLALFLVWPRTPVLRPAIHAPRVEVSDTAAVLTNSLQAPVLPIQRIHRRQPIAPVQTQDAVLASVQSSNVDMLPEEPVIQIAIPADEMFPPGAVPEGMHFAADVAIAPDGSAERLRLRPRLAGFERSSTQP